MLATSWATPPPDDGKAIGLPGVHASAHADGIAAHLLEPHRRVVRAHPAVADGDDLALRGELACAGGDPVELAAVQEQLAGTLRIVVLARGGRVWRDVDGVQPQLSLADRRIAVLELRARGA